MKRDEQEAAGSVAECSDLRGTVFYEEAESHFKRLLKPGSGRPTAAVDVSVSPDGRYAAFTGTMVERLDRGVVTRICLADVSGGALRVASFGPNFDATPRYCPRGRFLAFRSDRVSPGNFQLYLLDLATGMTRAAPEVDGWVEHLEFSPDGTRILVLVAGHGADASAVHGGKTSRRKDEDSLPAWMPAVDRAGDESRRRVAWLIDLQTEQAHPVSSPDLNIWEICWCGNDAFAAVVSEGAAEDDWYGAYLVRIPLTEMTVEPLYRPRDQLQWLSGSTDGKRLAVVEAVCSDRGLCAGDLRIVDVKNRDVRAIETGFDVTSTAWRDCGRVLLSGLVELETIVSELDARTGKLEALWRSEELYSWGPYYPQACPRAEKDFVMPAQGFRVPPGLLGGHDGNVRMLLSLGHAGTEEIASELLPVQPWQWQAPDGMEMQGWLLRGAGSAPTALIMEIHGGPIWRWSPFFLGRSAYHAMLIKRGYSFFWPNPRGSTGRGQDFARAVVGDMGGADALDLLSGLDRLIADGVADPQRIGVMGNSYGGYMSAWLISQDQRFAAAIPVAPIANWVSQHLTTNIPSFDEVYFDGHYYDSDCYQIARSPVMFAGQVRTPTLNICGAQDRCSPPGQAREFHNALLENDAKSVLVTYPREGHGIRGLPEQVDYSARIVAWFAQHMAGVR